MKPVISCLCRFIPPEIVWLWDFKNQQHDDGHCDNFCRLLQAFLQDPERCHHLSVGSASSPVHFARLCMQTVSNNYFRSSRRNVKNQRYLI
ncbi:hypothetical protein K443DRAFT_284686 [Laccaria amethystina LaAM-08-1]|uniref:Uncharacterized protein n=1 Tax=Laccaria amethystina LaAM-08-1 TaxID=1095629 RepID=A0A0C9XFE3_9AGAR|nr:hypothetical protein K443DRAFT_284686 [Laccaria amethystina LaAM-08-1]